MRKPVYQFIGTIALTLLVVEPVLAGPGGRIARAAFETFWGRVILAILTVFFLPLIIYIMCQEHLAARRAKKDLAYIASHDPRFRWLDVKRRAKECFQRVHHGWQDGKLDDVTQWMTAWYWQNQQLVFLDRWESQGLVNVCEIKNIGGMRPLLFVHRNDDGEAHEGSTISIAISANMQDYLKSKTTDEIVEGSKKWKNVETIWTLEFVRGEWLVADIEESDESLMYARMRKELPAIETTMASQFGA